MKNVAFLLPTGANIASLETARQGFLVANEYLAAQGRPPGFSDAHAGRHARGPAR